MPLNGLLRKRQRRLAGGTWVMAEAQGSFCLARSRAAKPILRTRSEVYFTGERGGSHGQGGWPYFFFLVPEVRRPLPAVRAGGLPSPPTLGRASSRRGRARPNHPARHRWLRIRRGLVRRPGPERGDGAFVFSRPPPASPRLYLLLPSLSAHRWAPSPAGGPCGDNRIPVLGAGGTGSDGAAEPTAAGARGAAGGRRGGARRGGGVGHPVSAAPASPAQPHRPPRPSSSCEDCARAALRARASLTETPGERRPRLHEARRELARRAREARLGGWGGGRGGGGARAGPACPRGRRWQRPRRRRGGRRPERSARAAARGSAPPPPAPA